jgi:hypothetical protein
MSEETITALYEPATGMIPCVIMQAMFGGDRRACGFFGPGDWNAEKLPGDDAVMVTAPVSQWKLVGLMSREERIEKLQHMRKVDA